MASGSNTLNVYFSCIKDNNYVANAMIHEEESTCMLSLHVKLDVRKSDTTSYCEVVMQLIISLLNISLSL